MEFHSLKISKIVSETVDTKTIYLEIPTNLKEEYNHLPGQYLTVRAEINGKELRRAYSICTSPGSDVLGITIKKVKKGIMSSFLNENVKEGDFLNVMTPEGNFIVKTDHLSSRDHYFVAAGSGITPIISMIETILEHEPKSVCYLLYGSRDENSIIFKNQLEQIAKKYEDQLFVQHVLSQPSKIKPGGIAGLFGKKVSEWKGMKGRITESHCSEFFKSFEPKNIDRHYYVCGPGDMIEKVVGFLQSRHIDNKKIHKEYFTSGTSEKSLNIGILNATVSVTLKGNTFDILVPKGKTILDVLVEAKKDPPYSCTSGACSTCMAKITEGEVSMDSCYALEDDEVSAGYILTCQSHPKTEKVVLSYDI